MHFLINQCSSLRSCSFKILAGVVHAVLGLESLPWPWSSPPQYVRINVVLGKISNNARHKEFYRLNTTAGHTA